MAQPSIESFQIDIALEDLNDVDNTAPVDGDIMRWNNSTTMWEPIVPSYYIDITSGGVGTTLPSGWSSSRTSAGLYVITHNLGTTELGYALLQTDAVAVPLPGNIIATTTNTFTIEFHDGTSATDTAFGGRVLT